MGESRKNRSGIVAILIIGAFITSLAQMVLTSALPSIMSTFNVTTSSAQWLTTTYILVLGIMIPSTAYLVNQFPIKGLFMTSMGLFLGGCIVSITANNFIFMVLSRVLQAIGAGIITQIVQVAMINLYPKEERGKAMGIYGFAIGVAPAIGPLVSGYIIDSFGWRFIFYILAIITILDVIFAVILLKSFMENKPSKLEVISLILSSLGFGGLLIGVTNIGTYTIANPLAYIPILIGLISLVLFVIRQIKVEDPLLDLRVFKVRNFTISIILICIVYMAMTSATMILSIYIQSARGMSAMVPGIVMLPGSIAMCILSPITGNILDKYGLRKLAISGCIMLGVGTLGFSYLEETTSIAVLTIMYTIRMIGITFLLMPVTTWGLNELKQEQIASGSAINSTLRQISGAVGSSLFVTIMTVVANNSVKATQVLADIEGMTVAFKYATFVIVIAIFVSIIYVKDKVKDKPLEDISYELNV
ncbi:MAG: MDR family MFS transporter [Peptostreptococcaceae bacterium]|nr:MDR family MFS transporter [Peptostreptococcaceae bacterium]